MKSLATYKERLKEAVNSRKKSGLVELCFDLEYELLLDEKWPPETFAFVIDALSDPEVGKHPGASALVTAVYNDFEKLSDEQRNVLGRELDINLHKFGDEVLRLAVADLVARKFEPSNALRIFSRWSQMQSDLARGMAGFGLEVLLMGSRLGDADRREAQFLLKSLAPNNKQARLSANRRGKKNML
jgi:hypothetical protein